MNKKTKYNANILNPKLYEKAKKKADLIYKTHSVYKSMYIQKVYKELGGKYKGKQNKEGVTRWNKEEWIQVMPYLERGEKIVCGGAQKKNKVCRPLIRVNNDTPITIKELLKLHPKSELIKLGKKKLNDMNGRVFWKTMKFYPSKK